MSVQNSFKLAWVYSMALTFAFVGCSLSSGQSSEATKRPAYVLAKDGVQIDGTTPITGTFSVKTDSVKIDGRPTTRFQLFSENFWIFLASNKFLYFAGMVSILASLVALFLFKSRGTALSLAAIGLGSLAVAALFKLAEITVLVIAGISFVIILGAFGWIILRMIKAKKFTLGAFKSLLSKEVYTLRDFLDDGKQNKSIATTEGTATSSLVK